MRASISFGIAGLSHVHYDAAVAATAAMATAACNLGAENRENRRVKMKRGSSQGKWGIVSSAHIYIHTEFLHTRTHTCKAVAACTKTAGSGRKLTPFPTFHPAYCFSLPLFLSPGRATANLRATLVPRIRSDFKWLRCRKTTCIAAIARS